MAGAGNEPDGLPEGFEWRERSGWRIAVRSDVAGEVLATAGGDPRAIADAGEARYEGRGRPALVVLARGTRAVVRRYLHGGLLRAVTGRYFVGRSRPLRELRATERARRAGVRVPEVLAAWHGPRAGLFHEGWILTREVAGARDLAEVLRAGERVPGAFRDLGREVRRMHEAGVLHGDLHVKNVLLAKDGVTILDFDRATVGAALSPAAREDNLLRFDRSVEKLGRRGVGVPRTDRLRFFAAYWPAGLARPERDRLAARCRRSLARHRLGWRILGGGR